MVDVCLENGKQQVSNKSVKMWYFSPWFPSAKIGIIFSRNKGAAYPHGRVALRTLKNCSLSLLF